MKTKTAKEMNKEFNRKFLENMFGEMDLNELIGTKEVVMNYIYRRRYEEFKEKHPEVIYKR